MACSREGCENILCSRRSPVYGNLCNECYNDLIDYLVSVNWNIASSEGESPDRYIKAFLKHPKGYSFSNSATINTAIALSKAEFPVVK